MTRLEFDEKIKQLGLTRKIFADIAKVSYSGISTNWKDDKENSIVGGAFFILL